MKHIYYTFVLIIIAQIKLSAQWNADAGVIPAHTTSAIVTASSASASAPSTRDFDYTTFWQSDAPLPDGYISKSYQNALMGWSGLSTSHSGATSLSDMTDGNVGTSGGILLNGSGAFLSFNFPTTQTLKAVSMKLSVSSDVSVYVFTSPSDSLLIGTYTSASNFTVQRYTPPVGTFTNLKLHSSAGFGVFEVAALASDPKEFIVYDFGTAKEVGVIHAKNYAIGTTTDNTKFYTSLDNITWTLVASANPSSPKVVTLPLASPVMARYVKVEQTLAIQDWNKAAIFEVSIYDSNDRYGVLPTAASSTVTVDELLGINGIWGWGHSKFSNDLLEGEGQKLFNDFNKYGRNYHSMDWDVTDPDNDPSYENMAIDGTQAMWWLDWDREYQAWNDAGLGVQITLNIDPFSPGTWSNPYTTAYNFGVRFATHFGPTVGNGLVKTFEVGNEPWFVGASFYRDILRGMAKGIKDTDPAMEVTPCALQAAEPHAEFATSYYHHYMGARVTAAEAPYIDALNTHNYSYFTDYTGTRTAVFPEHPNSSFRELINAIKFRDVNTPSKKMMVTEWGWDHSGGGEGCSHSECVSEDAAAAYGIRGLMMMLRLGVERAMWFFYANTDNYMPSGLFSRSGLLTSKNGGFLKKKTFTVFESLKNRLAGKYFVSAISEDENGWVYALGNSDGTITHYIGWLPVSADSIVSNQDFTVSSTVAPIQAYRLDGNSSTGTTQALPSYASNEFTMSLNAIPLVIEVDAATPVELVHFEVNCDLTGTKLEWITVSETNNKHFEIEHSPNGKQFHKIGTVLGNGTSSSTHNYAFLHELATEAGYYRLKQVDEDGNFAYSGVLYADCENKFKGGIQLFPNPTANATNVYIQMKPSNKNPDNQPIVTDIQICNMMGQIIHSQPTQLFVGINHIPLDVKAIGLTAGTYIVQTSKFKNVLKPVQLIVVE